MEDACVDRDDQVAGAAGAQCAHIRWCRERDRDDIGLREACDDRSSGKGAPLDLGAREGRDVSSDSFVFFLGLFLKLDLRCEAEPEPGALRKVPWPVGDGAACFFDSGDAPFNDPSETVEGAAALCESPR